MSYNKRARLRRRGNDREYGSHKPEGGMVSRCVGGGGGIAPYEAYETGDNIPRPESFPRTWLYGTDLYAPVLLNPTAQKKEERVDYALEKEKLEVLKQRLARLEAKQVITSVDEIGMKFIHEEIERISSRLPKDWDQFAVGGE